MENQQNLEDEIFYPQNVNSEYEYIEGLGMRELKRYILPAAAVVIGFALIPPYTSILFWVLKVLVAFVAIIICIFFIFLKPVPSRKNINYEMWLRYRREYKKRQKVYYIDKKDKNFYGR